MSCTAQRRAGGTRRVRLKPTQWGSELSPAPHQARCLRESPSCSRASPSRSWHGQSREGTEQDRCPAVFAVSPSSSTAPPEPSFLVAALPAPCEPSRAHWSTMGLCCWVSVPKLGWLRNKTPR